MPARARGRVCQRQMAARGCVYVLEMSRSHLHGSLCPAEEGGRVGAASCIGCLFASSLFSHMLVPFCLYCSLSHLSHSLPATVFASEPSSSTACLYLPVIAWPYLAALNIFIFYCSVYFYLLSIQTPPVSPFLHLFTIDPSGLFSVWLSEINPKKVTEIDARLVPHSRACIWCNDPKPKLLLL